MQRYFSLPFIIIFSIVFLFQSTLDAREVPSSTLEKNTKPATSTLKPVTKAKAATQTPTVKKTTRQAQPISPAAKSTSEEKSRKQQQVADSKAPSKSRNTDPVKKQVAAVAAAAKSSASSSAVTAKKKRAGSRSVASRKKASTEKTTATVSTGSLPDIERLISSRCVMVMDAGTGATLFAKSPDDPRQPASTIKIVTAMIALKSLKNDEVVNVSRRAADMPSSKIFLDPNQNYQANDLINAVLLASANDASVALAEKIAGTEDQFANLMTISAKMWGAQNTRCRTASGLTAEGQHSTARDLANLFRYAMQHDEFARRMQEKTIRTSYGKTLLNHNKALWRVDGAIGGKTGYTVAARQTYVGQFSRDGGTIVVAIMGSETMWADLKQLVEYGFSKKKQTQLANIAPISATQNTTQVN